MQVSRSQFELPVLPPNAAAIAETPPLMVADVVCTRLVRLPAWFTTAQAARVAELRGVDQVLVEEQGRIRGAVSLAALKHGSSLDTLARRLSRSDLFVDAGWRASDAWALMRLRGVACAPVVRGEMLIGTIDLEDVAAKRPTESASTPLAIAA